MEELIHLVRPDIVLLELCKERVPLLVNPDDPPPTLWHSSRQRLVGLPAGASWPAAAELLAHMRCRGGAPVTATQIEDDAASLLATGVHGFGFCLSWSEGGGQPWPALCALCGCYLWHVSACSAAAFPCACLFSCPAAATRDCCAAPPAPLAATLALPALHTCRQALHTCPSLSGHAGVFGSVSLNVKPPSPAAAPAFVVGSGGALQTVAPMGEIEFTVKERSLPKITQLEVVLEAGDAAALAGGLVHCVGSGWCGVQWGGVGSGMGSCVSMCMR